MSEAFVRLTSHGDSEPFFSEFPPQCAVCIGQKIEVVEHCPLDGRRARHSTIHGTHGSVFGCTRKASLVASRKLHEAVLKEGLEHLKTLGQYKRRIVEQYERAFKRMLHNVERNDAHVIQEFQNVVPDSLLIGSQRSFRSVVAEAISNDLSASAKALTNVFKAAIAIKNELTIYQRLYLDTVWRDELGKYKAHKVLMNTAYKFYDEFNETGIWLDVGECYDEVEIDFECVSVVIFHIMDNARKYAKPNSVIFVSFIRNSEMSDLSIRIEMTSLAVSPDESAQVELEGISGRLPQKLGKAGKGIGLSIVRHIVSRARLKFEVDWGSAGEAIGDAVYAVNVFLLGGLRLTRAATTRASR